MQNKTSVVLPIYIPNGKDEDYSAKHLAMTYKCLELARSKTKLPFELVIVETDSQYFIDCADVYIYEKEKDKGAERSHNRGFKVASGDFITLLTNDVYVDDNWLESLLECFKREDCGVSTLASTQFNHKKENKIEEGNWWSVAMIKKEIFDKVGYYDERFVNSWCDTDLLLRIYKAGYKMYRNFNCVVEHLIGQTVYDNPSFKEDYDKGQILFNEIHKDCKLPIFEELR